MNIHPKGLLNFGNEPISRQPAQLTAYTQVCQYRISGLFSRTKGQFNSLILATMVKHHTAYYPHGYTDRMNDQYEE